MHNIHQVLLNIFWYNVSELDKKADMIIIIVFSYIQIKNAEFFTQFITEDFDAYVNRKRCDSCHGNHLEMQAMAELYNRTIEVYQYSTGMALS